LKYFSQQSVTKLATTAFTLVAMQTMAIAQTFDINQTRLEAGVLTCDVSGGIGLIFGSKKDMRCEFLGADGQKEFYNGNVKKFGLDIGETKATTISWTVLAPTTELGRGSLEGEYAGLSAEATVGVGLGANLLAGGFDKSIALQPLSAQIQEGYNIAAGVGTMTLKIAQ